MLYIYIYKNIHKKSPNCTRNIQNHICVKCQKLTSMQITKYIKNNEVWQRDGEKA